MKLLETRELYYQPLRKCHWEVLKKSWKLPQDSTSGYLLMLNLLNCWCNLQERIRLHAKEVKTSLSPHILRKKKLGSLLSQFISCQYCWGCMKDLDKMDKKYQSWLSHWPHGATGAFDKMIKSHMILEVWMVLNFVWPYLGSLMVRSWILNLGS